MALKEEKEKKNGDTWQKNRATSILSGLSAAGVMGLGLENSIWEEE